MAYIYAMRGNGTASIRPRPGLRRLYRAYGVLCATLIVAIPLTSRAAGAFSTGFADPAYYDPTEATRELWFERTLAAGSRIVRIPLVWSQVATAQPQDAADPGDPAYDFSFYDVVLADAVAHGLKPLLNVSGAPTYASGPDRPPETAASTWRPDPVALGAFGRALAARYSGAFQGLPRVHYFQLWNEPNLVSYLAPQYSGRNPVGAEHYRRMLDAFYGGVKAVHGNNLVITGGTAPYGDSPGGARTRPLAFWREVLCLKKKRSDLRRTKCSPKPRFDVLAHHAINTSGGPRTSAGHPDDVSTPDLGALRRTLRAAERERTIGGGRKRHQLWVTEIWWESNPPDTFRGLPLEKHARYIEETLYLLWKGGAKVVINLLIRDQPYDPQRPLATTEAGLYFANGEPKPALTAFRFPFVTERRSKKTVRAWGKAPAGGRLVVEEQRGSGWRRVASKRVGNGKVFTLSLDLRGKAKLRGRVGDETSLVWRQGG